MLSGFSSTPAEEGLGGRRLLPPSEDTNDGATSLKPSLAPQSWYLARANDRFLKRIGGEEFKHMTKVCCNPCTPRGCLLLLLMQSSVGRGIRPARLGEWCVPTADDLQLQPATAQVLPIHRWFLELFIVVVADVATVDVYKRDRKLTKCFTSLFMDRASESLFDYQRSGLVADLLRFERDTGQKLECTLSKMATAASLALTQETPPVPSGDLDPPAAWVLVARQASIRYCEIVDTLFSERLCKAYWTTCTDPGAPFCDSAGGCGARSCEKMMRDAIGGRPS